MNIILNNIEKQVAVCLLLELMNAAPGVTDMKIQYFQSVAAEFKISQNDFDLGKELDPFRACSLLREFDDSKKTLYALVFRKMIQVDGLPSAQAIDIINDITIRGRLGDALKQELNKYR